MNDNQVNSWIFLAAGSMNNLEPVTYKSVLLIADGINHAVPTHKELQSAFKWLTDHGLLRKVGKEFEVTPEGINLFAEAKTTSDKVLGMWRFLENRFAKISME